MSLSPLPPNESSFSCNTDGSSNLNSAPIPILTPPEHDQRTAVAVATETNVYGGDVFHLSSNNSNNTSCVDFENEEHSNWTTQSVTSFEAELFSHDIGGPLVHGRHSTRRSWHAPSLHSSLTQHCSPTTANISNTATELQHRPQQQPRPRYGQENEQDLPLPLSRATHDLHSPQFSPNLPPSLLDQDGQSGENSNSLMEMEVPHPLAQSCQVQEEEHEQPQEQLEPERNETNTTSTTVPLDNASPTLEATSGDPPSPTSTVSSQTTRVEQLSIQPPPLAAMTLSLGSLSNFHPQRQLPVFNPADAPPPYSPTHTILPHYFSLVPIPIRSYTIKESHSLPSLLDFWLHTTSSLTRPSSPTGERLQLQERGLPPQTGGPELKYSLIRPTQSDRTAIPPGHPSFTQHNFIPPWALIRADMPGRWLWWGTEALHLVVFGRQLKNVYMEWRWRRGRTRIGGPIVTRLIGCSFRITPDRGYCWRQGTGRATNLTMATPPPSSSRSRAQRRRHAMTATRQRSTEHTVVDIGNGENTSPQDISVASGQRNASATSFTATMGSFFSRFMRSSNQPETTNTTAVSVTALVAAPSLPSAPPLATAFSTAASSGTAADIEMHTMPSNIAFNNQVQETVPFSERISGHATPGSIDSALIAHPLDDTGSRAPPNMGEEGHRRSETLVPSTQFTTHDSVHDNSYPHMDEGEGNEDISHDSDDDDDDDAGVYHCREESIDGVPGRLVAVYRPARAANRARDLPARSCKLEIYAEIGERCETVLMFMCTRLDDLFMSIPESKRMPVRSRRREHQRRHRSHGAHGEASSLYSAGGAISPSRDGPSTISERARGGDEEISMAQGDSSDVEQRSQAIPERPLTLKAFLRQKRTRRVLKMVVAIVLIVVVIVLVLRSSRSKK